MLQYKGYQTVAVAVLVHMLADVQLSELANEP